MAINLPSWLILLKDAKHPVFTAAAYAPSAVDYLSTASGQGSALDLQLA
jgi:antirestriction protein ArdC